MAAQVNTKVNSALQADHHHHHIIAAADLEKSDHMTSLFEPPILFTRDCSTETLYQMDGDRNVNRPSNCGFCADAGVPEAVTIIIGVEEEGTSKQDNHQESSSSAEKSDNSPELGAQTITETNDAALLLNQMKATTIMKDKEPALLPKVTRLLGGGENLDHKGAVCRICQLESDGAFSLPPPSTSTNLILLGCGCKGELATAHSHCAEAWFTVRGNRLCEICGETAENVTGIASERFMEQWNEGGRGRGSWTAERGRGRGSWTGQTWCNLLLACLVIAFVLPWFIRIDLF